MWGFMKADGSKLPSRKSKNTAAAAERLAAHGEEESMCCAWHILPCNVTQELL